MKDYKNNFDLPVSCWCKGDLIDLAEEYMLIESTKDMLNFSYCLDFDNLCDFVVFLFCGDWSRNISILGEEEQQDQRIKKLFKYVGERF